MWLPLYVHSPPGEHTVMGELDCSGCRVGIGREWRWALSDDPGFFPWSLSDEPLPHVEYRVVRVQFQEFASTTHNPLTGERGRVSYWIAAVLVDGSYSDLLRLAEFRPHPPRPVSRIQFRRSLHSPPHLTLQRSPPIRCIPNDEMHRNLADIATHYANSQSQQIQEHLARELQDTIYNLSPMATPFMDMVSARRGNHRTPVAAYGTSADTTPPEESKPLAPLPDWLDKVDSILAEHTTPQPGEP